MSMVDIVKLTEKLRAAVEKQQTQALRSVVKPLHAAFHGSEAKARLDVAVEKIKAEKLQKLKKEKQEKVKEEREKLKKAKKEKK